MSSTSWKRIFTTIRNLFHTSMFHILKSAYLYRSQGFFFNKFFFGTEKRHAGPYLAYMEAGASLQCCFFPEIHEQATMCTRVHYCDSKTMNCFAINQGIFFELLHTNDVELVGSTLYWPLTLWQELLMHYAIKIKEHSVHYLHIWPSLSLSFWSWWSGMPRLGRLSRSFNIIPINPYFITCVKRKILCTL